MKKYAYLITIVLLSFSCSSKMTPNNTEPIKVDPKRQTTEQCHGPNKMSPLEVVFSSILIMTVILSFSR